MEFMAVMKTSYGNKFCASGLTTILLAGMVSLLPSYVLCEESDKAVGVSSVSELLSGASRPGSRWALLIGINDYEDEEIRDLKYAVNDARKLHELLIDPECGGFDKENVVLLVSDADDKGYHPTKVNIMLTLDALARKAKQEDTVVILYSGHGFEEKVDDRSGRYRKKYLLPIETDLRFTGAYAIDNEDFVDKVKKIKAKRVIVFLDSCHAGGISRLGKSTSSQRLSPDYYKLFEDARGVITFSSCKGDQESFESDEYRHGIFTKYLLDALRGEADSNHDGVATFEEVQKHVHPRVKEWSIRFRGPKRVQEPVVHATDVTDFDVMITRCVVPGTLTLDVTPSLSKYSAIIDEIPVSAPVANHDLKPGFHRLDVLARGYEPFRGVIEIHSNQEYRLGVGLSPRSRLRAALKSTVLPGWGDLPDRRSRGILAGALQVGTLVGLALSHLDYTEKRDEYNSTREMDSVENEAFSSFREYEAHHTLTLSRYDKMLDARRLRDVFLVSATIGIRILAASEAAVFMPRVGGEVGGSLSGTDDGDVTLSWRREF